ALVQEPLDVAFLGVVVVNSDLGSELDLLDVDLRLVLPRELRLLLLLVAVLPVVHDPGHRRIRLGRDFDEIEVLAVRVLACLVRRLDPELLALLVDEPHTRDADRVVDACLGLGTTRRLPGTSARPQMLFTKLVLTSSIGALTSGTQQRETSSTGSVEHSIEPPRPVVRR